MNVLFITSSRLGDAVLSTGLLDHITRTRQGARVTVVCGGLPAPLFEGVLGLERIIILRKKNFNLHWIELWRKVAGKKWEIVVDLRNSAVSRLLYAKEKYIYSADIDRNLHKVEQNAAVMDLGYVPAPRLWLTDDQRRNALKLVDAAGGPVLAIGPTANWPGKMWPAENYIELIKVLTQPGGILPHARVAIFAAPGEEAAARGILQSIPPERQVDMIARCDPGTAAAVLSMCALYIGNDSGLTHCAAAVGIPALALFGPGWPHLYRPWGENAAYVSTPEDCGELTAYEGYDPAKVTESLMRSLDVGMVSAAAKQLINRSDGPSRHFLR